MTKPLPFGVPEPVEPDADLSVVLNMYQRERDTKQLRRPSVAHNACWAFADDFTRFARHHGLKSDRIVIEWPYLGEEDLDIRARLHFLTRIGDLFVDWTANQFSSPEEDAFPIPYVFRDVWAYMVWIDDEVWFRKYGEPRWRVFGKN
jgi:hypothetical protein